MHLLLNGYLKYLGVVTYDGLLKWNYNFACYKKCHGSSDDLLIYIDSDGLNMGEVSLNKYSKIQKKFFKHISTSLFTCKNPQLLKSRNASNN